MNETKIVYGNELYHYGILGQKWGVRRFQNEDGTLTYAGKKRYGYNYETGSYDTIKLQKDIDKDEYRKAKEQYKESARTYRDSQKEERAIKKAQKESAEFEAHIRSLKDAKGKSITSQRYANLTNAELKAAIDRISAEQVYKDLKAKDIKRGQDKIAGVLNNAKSAIGVATATTGLIKGVGGDLSSSVGALLNAKLNATYTNDDPDKSTAGSST